jgi:YesN/AraC family two-component response regulator
MKILIADDENFVRRGIISNMPWKDFGIDEIFEARDGREALSLAAKNQVDIVLSDIRMPGLDGIELVNRLREKGDYKIIFMSAYTDKEYLKSAIRFHAVGYVEKPIRLTELRSVLEDAAVMVLQKHRSGETGREEIRTKVLKKQNDLFWGVDDHRLTGEIPNEKEYADIFIPALLRNSRENLEWACNEITERLKAAKAIDASGARRIFSRLGTIVSEYIKTCGAIPPLGDAEIRLLKSINSLETLEQCHLVLLRFSTALLDLLKPLPGSGLLVARVIFILEWYYQDPGLYIPLICQLLSLSKSTLCGVFKKKTGKTVNEAIIQFRLEKACDLLQNLNLPISEISVKTGFTDQNYFTRAFKNMFGITPSVYRARLRS